MELEFFNPAGRCEATQAYARRLPDLKGRRIGIISNGDWQSFRSFPLLVENMKADEPSVSLLPLDTFPEGTDVISEDSTIAMVTASGVDAVILGNAACGACSTAVGVAAARLEAAGIPTVTIVREEFVGVVRNAASGVGLPGDLPMVPFPINLFLPDSELAPLSSRRQEIYDALVSWSPDLEENNQPSKLIVEGRNYEDALIKANDLYLINGWGDGLPLWPATAERVDWILEGTELPRDHLLGVFPPRGGVVSIESCAVALAMAGGRPEYLSILIAAVEAILDSLANCAQMQATSAATFPVFIVNGSIARQVRLNSGFGCLGPDPQRPAGASIGRAIRQMQQNLGGVRPGSGTMAPWGALRYTNMVFAEDIDGLPEGWLTHNQERHGFGDYENSLSFFWATGATNILRRGAKMETLEQDALQGMRRIAEYLAVPNGHYAAGWEEGTPGALLLTRAVATQMAAAGWTQDGIRRYLWENSKLSRSQLLSNGMLPWIEVQGGAATHESIAFDPWPITSKPDNISLVVAGGEHPTHAYWLQGMARGVIGKRIQVPSSIHQLLSQADRDLGCAADACIV